MSGIKTKRWAERYRENWIIETVRIFGYINREHIQVKFEISAQQASHDLQEVLKTYPYVMRYDVSKKRYEAIK